jgi:hypothetical protein
MVSWTHLSLTATEELPSCSRAAGALQVPWPAAWGLGQDWDDGDRDRDSPLHEASVIASPSHMCVEC